MRETNFCYHYTSRQAAQDIISGGMLKLGASEVIYLTPDQYNSGVEAANRLGIVRKPVEVRLEIPLTMIVSAPPITRVRGVMNGTQMVRQGLGNEFKVEHTIIVSGLTWVALSIP